MFMIDLDVPPCMKGGGNRNSRGDTTIVYALADPRNGTVRSVESRTALSGDSTNT